MKWKEREMWGVVLCSTNLTIPVCTGFTLLSHKQTVIARKMTSFRQLRLIDEMECLTFVLRRSLPKSRLSFITSRSLLTISFKVLFSLRGGE